MTPDSDFRLNSDLRFNALGTLEVWRGDRQVDLGRPRQRTVLAVLLLSANRVVSLDTLTERLWGDLDTGRSAGSLPVYIANLRRLLEPERPARTPPQVLLTEPPGYLLRVERDQYDVARFEALAAEGAAFLRDGDHASARSALGSALALWRGPAFADFTWELSEPNEVRRLELVRENATENRIEADLGLGRHGEVIAELEILVREHPMRERLWGLLMLALYRSGRQGEALRAYTTARTMLREELGIEPGPDLRRLETAILVQAPDLDLFEHPTMVESPTAGSLQQPPAPLLRRADGFVGRARELALFEQLVVETGQGRGATLLVSGEPGIGKTRLVAELAQRFGDDGALVAWGRGDEGDSAFAFWPWVQVLRALVGANPGAVGQVGRSALAQIANLVPEVTALVEDLEAATLSEPAAARFALFEAVAAVLHTVATVTSRPVVVILDDLQWAPVPSLRLTSFIAARAVDSPLVVVGTFRDSDPSISGPLAQTLAALARLPGVRLSLGGLSQDECRELLEVEFSYEPSKELVGAVWARTGGNPFYIGELARLIAAEGPKTPEQLRAVGVPWAVRQVISRRLSRMSEHARNMLSVASVCGMVVDLAVLTALATTGCIDRLAEALEEAVEAGILVVDPHPQGQSRFAHELTYEAILAELSSLRRKRLHAHVASALVELHGNDESYASEVAHHLFEATPLVALSDAYDAALRAAEVAHLHLAYEQAESYLWSAHELTAGMETGAERSLRELEVQRRLSSLKVNRQWEEVRGVRN